MLSTQTFGSITQHCTKHRTTAMARSAIFRFSTSFDDTLRSLASTFFLQNPYQVDRDSRWSNHYQNTAFADGGGHIRFPATRRSMPVLQISQDSRTWQGLFDLDWHLPCPLATGMHYDDFIFWWLLLAAYNLEQKVIGHQILILVVNLDNHWWNTCLPHIPTVLHQSTLSCSLDHASIKYYVFRCHIAATAVLLDMRLRFGFKWSCKCSSQHHRCDSLCRLLIICIDTLWSRSISEYI